MSPRTRSPDVDNRAEVGERSPGVQNGGGTDGDAKFNTSGGSVNSIDVTVTSGNDRSDAGSDEFYDGGIKGRRNTSCEAHRGDSGTARVVGGDPVDSRDDVGDGTGATVAENLNGNDVGFLGNTTMLISPFEGEKEANLRTRDQRQRFRHSEFRVHFRLCSRIQSVDCQEDKRGRSLTG